MLYIRRTLAICVTLGLIAGIAAGAILSVGGVTDLGMQVFGVAAVTFGFAGIGLAAAQVAAAGRLPITMLLAIACSLAGGGLWIYLIVIPDTGNAEPDIARLAGTCTALAFVLTMTGMFANLEARSLVTRCSRWVPVTAWWIVALVVVPLIWAAELMVEFLPERFFVLFIIALYGSGLTAILTSVLVPLIIRTEQRRALRPSETVDPKATFVMSCPRCTESLKARPGLTRCRKCRLAVTVEFQEPRCDCGFVLFRLQGDTCPECGAKITSSVA